MKKTVLLLAIASISSFSLHAQAEADPAAGKAKSAACTACHGADCNSLVPMFPKLAGQQADYLYHTLKAYKSGKRKNAIMAGQVASLSEADMENLAAYFSTQAGLAVKY